MLDYNDFSSQLNGSWEDILSQFGVSVGIFRGRNTKNGPCPLCGGSDRAHWHMRDGRPSLFCRACHADRMAAPEKVIMDLNNMRFFDFVKWAYQYINGTPIEIIAKRQKVAVLPVTSASVSNPKLAKERYSLLDTAEQLPFLLRLNCALNGMITHKGGYPIIPQVCVATGDIVNLARMGDDGISWLAGGPTYGAFWRINSGARKVLCSDPIDAIKLSWHFKGAAEIWCATCPRAATWAMYNLMSYLSDCTVAFRDGDLYDIDPDEALTLGYKVASIGGDNYNFKVEEL